MLIPSMSRACAIRSTALRHTFPVRNSNSLRSNNLAWFCSSSSTDNANKKNDTTTICDCFKSLGVEKTFSIPPEELKSNYKFLMNQLHPDRHAHISSIEERDMLHHEASTVTRCYEMLSNPQTRALHLLELHGKPMEEASTGALVGSEFLMEIMEVRETIDATSSDQVLQKLLDENRATANDICQRLEEAFDKNDLERALRLTATLQYWNRAEETIREKISQIE